MSQKVIQGTIRYTSNKPERKGAERGREFFTITQQTDGIDVLLAHCEIDDAPRVSRDVCVAMHHQDSSPVDASVRISVGGKFEGSGWMRFGEHESECESLNARDGRITQKIQTSFRPRWFQAHPIVGDGLLMRLYPLAQGPGIHHVDNIFLSSPDHRGATGPLFFVTEFDLVYVGDEVISIAAGTFNARHFQVTGTAGNLPEEHPPYDIWCSADDDYLFLKGGVAGYMQTHYELERLDRQVVPT